MIEYNLDTAHSILYVRPTSALTADDFATMEQFGGAMIWSPLSNLLLYGKTAKIKAAAGKIRIGIGPDWSPSGSNSETTRKRRPPSDLSGRGGRWGTHGGRLRILGSPSSSRAFSDSALAGAPMRP